MPAAFLNQRYFELDYTLKQDIRQLNAKLEEAENNCVDATMQLLTSTVQLQETEEFNTILVQKSTAMQDSLKVSLIFFSK